MNLKDQLQKWTHEKLQEELSYVPTTKCKELS